MLKSNAASKSCSIFRVPQNIMKLHSQSFQPSIVSIGPYHHGEEHLKMIEEHKWRILSGNLVRLKPLNVSLYDLFFAVGIKEKEIRECYSESIDKYCCNELIEMMILDGGFIIELLCVANKIITPELDDPIFRFPWMLSSLIQDLLMLENQIPFFVLEVLYAKSISDHYQVPSLQELILTLFNYSVSRYVDVNILCERYKNYDGNHILDFYRNTFLPSSPNDDVVEGNGKDEKSSFQFIQPVEKLRESGIKFKKRKEDGFLDSFLEIKFRDGSLEIPCLTTSEIMSILILNCIAFEQCSKDSSKHFTSYFNFMGYLINTTLDAEHLRKNKILENFFGTDKELVSFFNEVGKKIPYYFEEDYLMKTCKDVEKYYRNRLNVEWEEFKSKYCGSVVVRLSAMVAFFLIILSALQAGLSLTKFITHTP